MGERAGSQGYSVVIVDGRTCSADDAIVRYCQDTPLASFAAADLTPRQALRTSKSPAEELGLLDPAVPDETLLDAMLDHPVLVNRPIVCTPKGVRLCRPSETVLDLLDQWPPGPLTKEDGQLILDETGQRVG